MMNARGYTLVELLAALALGALVLAGLAGVVRTGAAGEVERTQRAALAASAQFALERMSAAVRDASAILLPLSDNPGTAGDEAVREQSSPARVSRTWETAVLALPLSYEADRNGNGVPDADNDGDGRFDEDHHTDSTNDAMTGIAGIDDDNDGLVDEILLYVGDDDEDGALVGEDPLDGVDDDGDGTIDDDVPADMNDDGQPGIAGIDDDGDGVADEGNYTDDDEDGKFSEDGIDPVVFRLVGSTLTERVPVPWDENNDGSVTAADWVELPLAEGVTYFRVERVETERATLVDVTLTLTGAGGATLTVRTQQRVGGGR
jgi:prepilin-type N-terminal cleavage/methylation domain-containing protein